MCSIIGIKGQNSKNKIFKMIELLNHRGPDATGIYSDNKVLYNSQIYDIPESNFIMAHNLLSIVGDNEIQPIQSNNLTLVANAEIYNYADLKEKYEIYDVKSASDCEIILKIIEKHYADDLKDAVMKTIPELDGDYAFCVTNGTDFIAVRDDVGVKPLYYASDKDNFAFASESKALKAIHLDNISTLKPTQAIYNNGIITVRNEYSRYESTMEYDELKKELSDSLVDSVRKRVGNLDQVALLFSAGVDSTLIAAILKRLNVETTLYTVGTKNSQDMQFAKKVAEDMDLPLKMWIIDEDVVADNFQSTINIIEDKNLMKIGVGMTINLTSQIAHKDNHKVMLSGQGADELFCGYNRYKNKYNTPDELLEELTHDLNNMYHVNLERDDKATMNNSIELRVPYLDRKVIQVACKTPVKYMLHSDEDNIRKHILRDVAYELGVPEYIAYRPKKAAQYGTGIDKIIKKKLLKQDEYRKMIY